MFVGCVSVCNCVTVVILKCKKNGVVLIIVPGSTVSLEAHLVPVPSACECKCNMGIETDPVQFSLTVHQQQ